MAKKEYWELLRDPRWQRRRLEIMERADFACEECGDNLSTLNVHHKVYRKGAAPWEYADQELITLCEQCHEAHHGLEKRLKATLSQLSLEDRERVLGYARGIQARAEIEPSEDTAAHKPDSYELPSEPYVCGFLDALWIEYNYLTLEGWFSRSPITASDLWSIHFTDVSGRSARLRGNE